MAPRKRKTKGGESQEGETAAKTVTEKSTTTRVTRSSARLANSSSSVAPPAELPKAKKSKATVAKKEKAKPVEKEETETEKETEAKNENSEEKEKATEDGASGKTIVIEHCKQCNSFKTRAVRVKDSLENSVPGVNVRLNPDKPRKGCFEIREEGGDTFISLLDMKRPFKPMKDLDMEQVISDIIDKIK